MQQGDSQSGNAVTDGDSDGEDGALAEEFANDDMPARQRVGEDECHGAALDFADDGVVGKEQGDERDEVDVQCGEADHGNGERTGFGFARRGTAEEGKRQGEGGE